MQQNMFKTVFLLFRQPVALKIEIPQDMYQQKIIEYYFKHLLLLQFRIIFLQLRQQLSDRHKS